MTENFEVDVKLKALERRRQHLASQNRMMSEEDQELFMKTYRVSSSDILSEFIQDELRQKFHAQHPSDD